MDTDNIMIFEKDLLAAHRICANIADPHVRNKAVANVLAAKIAAEYFDSANYEIDTQTGLHNIAFISEQFEIADLYVNDAYIDVRVYFSDEEMCVPKVHFDTGILPVAYMFVKLSQDIKEATVTGFVYPERIDKTKPNGDVYPVAVNDLCNLYDIEMRLQKKPDTVRIDDVKIYELLEGTIDAQEVTDIFKILVASKYSRVKLVKAAKAQSVFNFVSTPEKTSSAEVDNLSFNNETDLASAIPETSNGAAIADDDIDLTDEDLDSLFDTEVDSTEDSIEDYATEVTPSGADVIESLDNEEIANEQENSEQIETLFNGEQEGVPVANKKKKGSLLPVLLLAVLICGGVYFWHTHKANQLASEEYIPTQSTVADVNSDVQEESQLENVEQASEAMPVETVEDTKPNINKEESTSVAIPAIERSLDASVLVSNLKIDWEVPEGYASNTSAKRYLVKLGKIIQLDLKTELLLLNKPPLSNKITVELKYNPSMNRFEAIGIQMSSGEKTVDDTILKTVKSVLTNSMSASMESFAKLQGNPVLIIHL